LPLTAAIASGGVPALVAALKARSDRPHHSALLSVFRHDRYQSCRGRRVTFDMPAPTI
jgi:hypothetical protein